MPLAERTNRILAGVLTAIAILAFTSCRTEPTGTTYYVGGNLTTLYQVSFDYGAKRGQLEIAYFSFGERNVHVAKYDLLATKGTKSVSEVHQMKADVVCRTLTMKAYGDRLDVSDGAQSLSLSRASSDQTGAMVHDLNAFASKQTRNETAIVDSHPYFATCN